MVNKFDSPAMGTRLQHVLSLRQISLNEMAKMTNTSRSTVTAWLKGKNLTLNTVQIIARALDLSVNWLVLAEGDLDSSVYLELSPQEKALIYLMRSISTDFSKTSLHLLELMNQNNSDIAKHVIRETADQFINEAGTALAVVDTQGKILDSNKFHDKMIGLDSEEMCSKGMSVYDIVAESFHSKLKSAIRSTFE